MTHKPLTPVLVKLLHEYEHDEGGVYEIGEILKAEYRVIRENGSSRPEVVWALLDGIKIIHFEAEPGIDFDFV